MKWISSTPTWMLTAALFLSACAKSDPVSEQIAEDTQRNGACQNFSDKVRATLSSALIDGQPLPLLEDLRQVLSERLLKDNESEETQALLEQVLRVYQTLTEETQNSLGLKTSSELLEALTALEIGDRTTPEKARLQEKLNAQFKSVQTSAEGAGLDCEEPVEVPTPTPPPVAQEDEEERATQVDPVLKGAVRVMTTAYQGCQAVDLPAMTTSSPTTQGIAIVGEYPGGRGLRREVRDLAALNRTHYYVREGIENREGCFNVPANPLIYDFGGKPYARSDEESPLDLFKDAGTGTKVLGIDCSGYVFSAMAASGLRLSPGRKLKASQVYGVNAAMMMNPVDNGLSCLNVYQPKKDDYLRSGDILASSGHVVVIDVTGSDPYGLRRAQSVSQCTSSVLTPAGFDFDVLHSAPVKGGIGLNRMRASTYLADSSSMRTAMIAYAVSSCKVKFGQSPNSIPSSAHLVRHKQTTECKDRAVSIARESCVQSCGQRTGLW